MRKPLCLSLLVLPLFTAFGQPMLESGSILPLGASSFECSSLSFPVQRDDRTQFYSQIQFQGHYALSEKWEMRLASATGWDPTVKHGSLLAGLTYQWMQNGAWSSALSGTVSKLYGDQIIPQHKFWLGATHSGRYEHRFLSKYPYGPLAPPCGMRLAYPNVLWEMARRILLPTR